MFVHRFLPEEGIVQGGTGINDSPYHPDPPDRIGDTYGDTDQEKRRNRRAHHIRERAPFKRAGKISGRDGAARPLPCCELPPPVVDINPHPFFAAQLGEPVKKRCAVAPLVEEEGMDFGTRGKAIDQTPQRLLLLGKTRYGNRQVPPALFLAHLVPPGFVRRHKSRVNGAGDPEEQEEGSDCRRGGRDSGPGHFRAEGGKIPGQWDQ